MKPDGPGDGPTETRWRAVPWLLAALAAAPILLLRYPPMTDLPLHEVPVAILRHRGDPAFDPPGLYQSNWGHPNQLFYVLAWALAYVVPVATACKLVVCASVASLPLATARLARRARATPWTCVLCTALGYGFTFYWGLVTNLLGLAVLLWLLPTLERHCRAPTPVTAATATSALVLLYFAHETAMLGGFVVLGTGAFLGALSAHLGRGSGPAGTVLGLLRASALRTLPIALVAPGILFQMRLQERTRPEAAANGPAVFDGPVKKVAELGRTIFGHHGPLPTNLMLALLVASAALVALSREPAPPDAPPPASGTASPAERVWAHSLGATAAAFLVAYFVLPAELAGATMFYQRFLLPAVALAVVAAGRGAGAPTLLARGACCATPLASLALAFPQFVDAHTSFVALDRVAIQVAPGSAVAGMHIGAETVRAAHSATACGHIVALRGGRCLFDITHSPISPVVLQRAARWNEPSFRLGQSPFLWTPERDFVRFHYVLLRAYDPAALYGLLHVMEPEGRLVAREDVWLLFESTVPQPPLTTPDAAFPRQGGRPIGERLVDILAALPPEEAARVGDALQLPLGLHGLPAAGAHGPR
jgi:hypothetical protein